jgi:hypothetical protein
MKLLPPSHIFLLALLLLTPAALAQVTEATLKLSVADLQSNSVTSASVEITNARKITRAPAQMTRDDYAALITEFKEQGALEVLLQCGNFAYMNRFTDGLRLPSEDEAIKTYQETYGRGFEELRKAGADQQ